jgi:hypothetical protein
MTITHNGKLRFYVHFTRSCQTRLLEVMWISAQSIAKPYDLPFASRFDAAIQATLHSPSMQIYGTNFAYQPLTNPSAVSSGDLFNSFCDTLTTALIS